ncbi:hypothetical protein GCM10009554_76330 [Kribbella koreensis]|uniref:DUF559 domain-containing protein n=1 Tax=Kribbella koreensis TaxID=57909 RepID=A0ABP4C6W9_9ACTN
MNWTSPGCVGTPDCPSPTARCCTIDRTARRSFDAEWTEYGLIVEIDGIHHAEAPALIADALRQNDLTNNRSTVLRIPVLALRTEPARFVTQIRTALLARGWRGPATSEEVEQTSH